SLGRLGAIIVFDQFDLARPVLSLDPAALVIDLMRPQSIRWKVRHGRTRCERTRLGADHADLDGRRIGTRRAIAERTGERRGGGILQKVASSHAFLPCMVKSRGWSPVSFLETQQ